MNEPYILVSITVILSMGNFVLWWLLFDEDFTRRIEIYDEAHRDQMKQEKVNFVSKMQGIIGLRSALKVAEFDENWKDELENVNLLIDEAQSMRRHTVWVHYFALEAIFFAASGLALPDGMAIGDFVLYSTSIAWWIIVMGILTMIGLLVHYQLIENKSEPITEGEHIRDDSGIHSISSKLRKKIPL